MRPDSIPIVPVPVPDPLAGLSGNAPVVLRETAQKLRRLVDAGEAYARASLAISGWWPATGSSKKSRPGPNSVKN